MVSFLLAVSVDSGIHIHDLRFPSASVSAVCQSPLASPLRSLSWSTWDCQHIASGNAAQQIEVFSIAQPALSRSSLSSSSDAQPALIGRPTYQLQTQSSLHSAYYAPFGHSLVTLSSSSAVIELWNVGPNLGEASTAAHSSRTDVTAVAALSGHAAAVTHLDWQQSSSSSPALRSLWSLDRDRTLLVHELPLPVRAECGDEEAAAALGLQGAETEATADGPAASSVSSSAMLQFQLLQCARTVAAFRYHSFSPTTRSCEAEIESASPGQSLQLLISFPPSFPVAAPAAFCLLPSSSPLFTSIPFPSSSFLHELSEAALTRSVAPHSHFSLYPALAFLQRFVDDAVLRHGRESSASLASTLPASRQRAQQVPARIEEESEHRGGRAKSGLLIRKPALSSASTPALFALASSPSASAASQAPLSSSMSSFQSLQEEEASASPSSDSEADETPMATMEEDEEDEEGGARDNVPARKRKAEAVRRLKARDTELPCLPRLCGVSWGPRCELVIFNNFPQLSEDAQRAARMRKRREKTGEKELEREEDDAAHDSVHAVTPSAQPLALLNKQPGHQRTASHQLESHEELKAASAEDGEEEEQQQAAGDELTFPPRSLGQLLQLPFHTHYLAPSISEQLEHESSRAAIKEKLSEDAAAGERSAPQLVSAGAEAEHSDAAAADSAAAGRDEVSSENGEPREDEEEDEEEADLNTAPISSLAVLALSAAPPPARRQDDAPSGSPPANHARGGAAGLSVALSSTPSSPHLSQSAERAAAPVFPSLLPSNVIAASSPTSQFQARINDAAALSELPSASPSPAINTAVLMADMSALFPVDLTLSSLYQQCAACLTPSPLTAASASLLAAGLEQAAASCGRTDMARLWQLMRLVFRPELIGRSEEEEEEEGGWGGAAWGGALVRELMRQYWSAGDVETVGLIACLLSLTPQRMAMPHFRTITHSPGSAAALASSTPSPPPPPARSVMPHQALALGPAVQSRSMSAAPSQGTSPSALLTPSMLRSHSGNADYDRSPTFASSSPSSHLPSSSSLPTIPQAHTLPHPSSSYLHVSGLASPSSHAPASPSSMPAAVSLTLSVDDLYKLQYAEHLLRLGLMQHRAAVLRCLDCSRGAEEQRQQIDVLSGWSTAEHRIAFDPVCQRCGQSVQRSAPLSASSSSAVRCSQCNVFAAHCVICQLSLRGLATVCLQCGHGGHMEHIREWFEGGEKECATGCGCRCWEQTIAAAVY